MKRQTPFERAIAAFLLFAYAFAPAFLGSHFLFVEHEVCHTHQALHHVDSSHSSDAEVTEHAAVSSDVMHVDEHCGLEQQMRRPDSPQPAASDRLDLADQWMTPEVVAVHGSASRGGLDPLDYAPKTSPPIVG